VKLIKEGIWFEFTCLVCGSVCQAEPADVKAEVSLDCDGDDVGCRTFHVECGKCGGKIAIPTNKLTKRIADMARKKFRKR